MKKLLLIAGIIGLIYWVKNRKPETIEETEPEVSTPFITLKNALIPSASAQQNTTVSSDSGSSSNESGTTVRPERAAPTSTGTTTTTTTSSEGSGSRRFSGLEKPKSCFL